MPAKSLNAVRFRSLIRRGHVESYFFKAADAAGQRALWIKATIYASAREPDRALAEGWAIAFDRRGREPRHIAVKHTLPYEAASFSDRDLGVHWQLDDKATPTPDGLALAPGTTCGRVSNREHRISWDLRFSGDAPPIIPLPSPSLYEGTFPRVKLCTPNPDARFEGEAIVDGELWAIDGWRGMQGHSWGRGHAKQYAFCHISAWEGDDTLLFEGMSADLRFGPLSLPVTTLLCVRHGGVAYDFNAPLDLLRARGDIGLRRWEFTVENGRARIEGAVEAATPDFVGLYSPDPDGDMSYCLNTSFAHARVRFEVRGGPACALTSSAAMLEIGTPDEDHGVRMYV